MNRGSGFAAVALTALLVACNQSPAPSTQAGQPAVAKASQPAADARLKGSSRVERDGWIYVHLEGPPATLGFQHGYLLAAEIADLLRVEKPYLEHTTKRDWNFYRDAAEKMLWPTIDPEYQQEIDGIVAGATAKGVQADRFDLVALNGMLELSGYYVPWLDKQEKKTTTNDAPEHCSAFVATGTYTKDGRIVMGHNAWTDYVVGSRWNIVFDLKPTQGFRILMDGLPGIIISDDDFGINSNGIMVTETTIGSFHGFDPKGRAEFARARKAMQYSTSVDDFVRFMLDGNNGGYANDWLLGDNKTGEIARFELGLKEHSVERTKDGYFVGANFPVGEKLMKNETTFDPSKKGLSANARRVRWEQLMAEYKGRIDAEAGKQFESDKYDVIEKKDGPTERSLCGVIDQSPRGMDKEWGPYFPGGTVQAKVTDAKMTEAMQFWAAMGHPCAPDFIAEDFLKQRPQFDWMRGLLRDMKTGPWTIFSAR